MYVVCVLLLLLLLLLCVCAGSRQLFLGDVQSGIKKFGALFFFLADVSSSNTAATQQ